MISKTLLLPLSGYCWQAAAVCLIAVSPALAETIPFPLIEGGVKMTRAELADVRGGFVVPGGFEIAVGVDGQSLAGQVLSQTHEPSQTALHPSAALSTQFLELTSGGQVSTVADPGSSGVGSLVQNVLNNATLQQLRQINITLSNYTQIQALTGATASQFAQQTSFGQISGLK